MNIKPIIPFEPIKQEEIPEGKHWVYQIKWDGVRILTYCDGSEVKLFNRNLNERTKQFPEVVNIKNYANVKSIILDGEIIAFKEGRPSFSQVMKRDRLRSERSIQAKTATIPICYCIFDILYLNGDWLLDTPLNERQEILKKVIKPTNAIQLVKNYDDGEQLFTAVKEQQLEGMICKDVTSSYELKGKDKRWLKIKNFHDIHAVIGGVTYRGNTVNSLLLGMYDKEQTFHYVGHAGTGKLSQDDWTTITKLIETIKTDNMPFVHKPDRAKGAVWVKPQYVVKIQYIEWPKGQSIRQPSIQAFIDKPAEGCLLPEDHSDKGRVK
ncbi:non-homologous end-joining DNA ligase [Bacillus shivajii]|uniref:non-homologous end-joining DNA ligase n=1 Tax=Bacillus shivajii TaxID=1983719 RepID=UPI001CFB3D73|nr:non-homologous end-joining DNA ligase [Bacillus shivajii]UCZ52224.1 non-homologous end-joining DNA ligase [Bacillus shivajii]